MKTIHTRNKAKTLIKKLYKAVLKDDNQFHFFYEPELIIRVRNKNVEKVTKYLEKQGVKFEVYDYPYPRGCAEEDGYCFESSKFVRDNLEMFKKIYHFHSVANLTLSEKKYKDYLGRIMHTACNVGGLGYCEEGIFLISQGIAAYLMPYSLEIKQNREWLIELIEESLSTARSASKKAK